VKEKSRMFAQNSVTAKQTMQNQISFSLPIVLTKIIMAPLLFSIINLFKNVTVMTNFVNVLFLFIKPHSILHIILYVYKTSNER